MKRTILRKALLLFLIIGCFPALADEGEVWFPNWLVGVSAGYGNRVSHLAVRNVVNLREEQREPFPGAYIVRPLNDSGWIWGGFIGYQAIRCQWLKGIELSVDYHPISQSKAFAFADPNGVFGYSGLMRYQRRWMGALTGRFGYALTTQFMPYVRLGAELGSDRLTTSYSSPGILDNFLITNEQRQWVYRFLLGAGIEMPLVPSCGTTLRLEYNFHSKGKTVKTEVTFFDNVIVSSLASEAQPYTQSMRLVLVWNFF